MDSYTRGRKYRDQMAAEQQKEHEAQREREALKDTRCSKNHTKIDGMPVTLAKYNNKTDFTFCPPDERSMKQFIASYGSENPDFVYGLLRQLANADSGGRYPDIENLEFALAAVKEMQPRDPVESLIGVHMTMIHNLAMRLANRLAPIEDHAEMVSTSRLLNQSSRTFCDLVAIWDRRRSESAKIAVKQVSTAEGAPAIVGDVRQNGAKARRNLNGHANLPSSRRKPTVRANGVKTGRKVNGHASA